MDPADGNAGLAPSGAPIRYELVPLPQRYLATFPWSKGPPTPPPLVLDMGTTDAIWVIDPTTNALIASASLAQVTVTPARHIDNSGESSETEPLLIVDVPGMQPLRIRARPMRSGDYRYGWCDVERGADQPAYVVEEAEWLALVEKFGLNSRIVDDYASGEIARRKRRETITALAGLALILLLLAVSAYLKYGR